MRPEMRVKNEEEELSVKGKIYKMKRSKKVNWNDLLINKLLERLCIWNFQNQTIF